WRGPSIAECGQSELARLEADRLDELHTLALEGAAQARLTRPAELQEGHASQAALASHHAQASARSVSPAGQGVKGQAPSGRDLVFRRLALLRSSPQIQMTRL